MIITRELIERVQTDSIRTSGADIGRTHEILQSINGHEWFHVSFPYFMYLRDSEGLKKTHEFVDWLVSEYELTEGTKDFGFSVNKIEKTWKIYDSVDEFFGDDLLLAVNGQSGKYVPKVLFYTQETIPKAKKVLEKWLELVVPRIEEVQEKTRFVSILTQDTRGGFDESVIPLGEKLNVDITKNYMPDLPDQDIKKKLETGTGGIMIFHGVPGTGKSTYIKYLMESMPETTFVILDPMTIQVASEGFKNYLIQSTLQAGYDDSVGEDAEEGEETDYFEGESGSASVSLPVKGINTKKCTTPGKVYILEDAEKLLLKRNESTNPVNLSNILNITDGIIGDLVKAKFICTFNCDLSEIDDALLRKGRLLQKYEFKPLTGEVLKNLQEDLGIPENMRSKEATLSDLYGWKEANGMEQLQKSKIGF